MIVFVGLLKQLINNETGQPEDVWLQCPPIVFRYQDHLDAIEHTVRCTVSAQEPGANVSPDVGCKFGYRICARHLSQPHEIVQLRV